MSIKLYLGLFDQDNNELTYKDYRRENVQLDYGIGMSYNKHVIKLFNINEIKFPGNNSKKKLIVKSLKLFDTEDNILLHGLFDNLIYVPKSGQVNISKNYLELFFNNEEKIQRNNYE